MSSEKKYTRSVSQLKSATKCGESYAISRGFRGERPPSRPWAQTVAGRAFHDMIMEWEKSERTLDPLQTFNTHWDKFLAEAKAEQPDLSLWMRPPGTKTGETAIKNVHKRFVEKDIPKYIQRCKEAEWEVFRLADGRLALEIEFELDLDGLTVRGTIDRIQWWPEAKMVAVEDTKTGSPDDEDDARQLGLYRFGAEEVYDIDLTMGRYWFTKLDRPSSWFDLTRYSRERLTEHYHKLDNIIQQDLLLPNPGKGCKLCDVRPWCGEQGWLKPGEKL